MIKDLWCWLWGCTYRERAGFSWRWFRRCPRCGRIIHGADLTETRV